MRQPDQWRHREKATAHGLKSVDIIEEQKELSTVKQQDKYDNIASKHAYIAAATAPEIIKARAKDVNKAVVMSNHFWATSRNHGILVR